MRKKVVYKKSELLGDEPDRSKAMKDISSKDKEYKVLNQRKERKQLFKELKKYRKDGVTETELRGVLADLKYSSDNHFSKKEVDELAEELNIGEVRKKHRLSSSARRYSSQGRRTKNETLGDSIRRAQDFSRRQRKGIITKGSSVYEREEEDLEYFDRRKGKRYKIKTTKLMRPHSNVKSQSSLRGKGIIAGSDKNN
ncbi:MAG: hypothetical protein ABFQ53_00280 [Patescibacteria group bacterium]